MADFGPEYDSVRGGFEKLLRTLDEMPFSKALPGVPLSMLIGEKKILGPAYARVMMNVEEKGCLLEIAIRLDDDGEVFMEGAFGAKRYLGKGTLSEATLRTILDKVAEGPK